MKVFSNQHSAFRMVLIALMGMALTGCSLFGGSGKSNDPEFKISDLQALWLENNTQHYVRFTEERSDEYPYFYGREWDEAEDIFEEDLLEHGNGWFKYKFENNGNLTEIHLMDNGGAEIPKVYVVSKLTETDLEYYEKDRSYNKFYFKKVVETK